MNRETIRIVREPNMDITEYVTAVIQEHGYSSPIARSHPWAAQKQPAGCRGCDWENLPATGHGKDNLDAHASHVAREIVAALGLT